MARMSSPPKRERKSGGKAWNIPVTSRVQAALLHRMPPILQRTSSVVLVLALALGGPAGCGDSNSGSPVREQLDPYAARAAGFNVLVVSFDTVRTDAIGCYGDPRARTPNIDALAQQGVRFARAISHAPVTLPSHATLFTGLDPLAHGVHNNGTFVLADSRRTLAEELGERGYRTGAVVAGFVLDARFGLAQGFASYEDNLEKDALPVSFGNYTERSATRVTDHALEWLGERPQEPFFLWTHYFDAHAPYAAPLEHLQGQRRSPDLPYDADSVRREYLAEVTYADAELGRLLRGIPEEVRARTLVVFTSDHGESLGEHGEYTHSRLLYEGTLRVPLVLSNPQLFPGARVVSDRVVGLVDVTPTVLSMLGIASTTAFDGLPLLQDGPDPERAIFSETMVTLYNHGWAPLFASTRVGDKFVLAPTAEYYNLRSDAGERTNLFSASQPVAQSLAQRLRARLAQRGLDPTVPSAVPRERELDAQQERWLAELGYSRGSSGGQPVGRADPKLAIRTWARLSNASNLAQRGDTARALATVEEVLAVDPNDLFALEVGFQAASFAGDDARAEAYIRKRLASYPTPDLTARLGALLVRTARADEALALVETALVQHPLHGELLVVQGQCALAKGQRDAARELFRRALEVDPVRAARMAREQLSALGLEAPASH